MEGDHASGLVWGRRRRGRRVGRGVVHLKEQGTRWVQRISPAALLVQIRCQHRMPEFI